MQFKLRSKETLYIPDLSLQIGLLVDERQCGTEMTNHWMNFHPQPPAKSLFGQKHMKGLRRTNLLNPAYIANTQSYRS